MPEWIMELLGISIPIIAVSGTFAWLIIRSFHSRAEAIDRHRERMEMIEQGMHPDRPELEAGDLDESERDLIER